MQNPFADSYTVVTGGAGFIGSHLVDALVAQGSRVKVLDNFSTGHRRNLAAVVDQIELVDGDIRDLETCRSVCQGARYVFHQAALGSVPRSMSDPATTFAVNVQGTVNMFTAAYEVGVESLVFASSSSVYGDSQELPKIEGREGVPLSPYAASKRTTEDLATVYGRCFDLPWIALRYFNVYGSRQDPEGPYAAVIPRFFRAALTGTPLRIFGDGQQSRDFTHVSDAVRANLLAAMAQPAARKRSYNVAAGERTTVLALAEAIRNVCDSPAAVEHLEPRPGDVRHSLADLSLVGEALGYAPQTALEGGLAQALDYYRQLTETATT